MLQAHAHTYFERRVKHLHLPAPPLYATTECSHTGVAELIALPPAIELAPASHEALLCPSQAAAPAFTVALRARAPGLNVTAAMSASSHCTLVTPSLNPENQTAANFSCGSFNEGVHSLAFQATYPGGWGRVALVCCAARLWLLCLRRQRLSALRPCSPSTARQTHPTPLPRTPSAV